MYDAVFQTNIGMLGINMNGDSIRFIDFDVNEKDNKQYPENVQNVILQIQSFLDRSQKNFSLVIKPEGTEYQLRVWKALQQIPYGETRTYGEIASQLNSSARAVGNACRRNPIPIVIPCHRVVAKTGIGGFSGQTKGFQIDRKQALLKLETTS